MTDFRHPTLPLARSSANRKTNSTEGLGPAFVIRSRTSTQLINVRSSGGLSVMITCVLRNHLFHPERTQYPRLHRSDGLVELVRPKIETTDRAHRSLACRGLDQSENRVGDLLRIRSFSRREQLFELGD